MIQFFRSGGKGGDEILSKEILDDWIERLFDQDRRATAKLISLVEDDIERTYIMRSILKQTKHQMVVGVTGPPGAGKSSLVESLTKLYRQKDERVGIIAVDPSSPYTGGALLGDRIRMQAHGTDKDVFIRSMGTRGHLGGGYAFNLRCLTYFRRRRVWSTYFGNGWSRPVRT